MQITISLGNASIRQAKQQIKDYTKEVDKKSKELCMQLANEGSEIAKECYNDTEVMLFNSKPISVIPLKTKEGSRIIANGEQLMFVEFGTGVYSGMYHEGQLPSFVGYGKWSSSENGSGVLIKKGYWHFRGIKLIGTAPKYGMLNAQIHIRNQINEIAKGVFK